MITVNVNFPKIENDTVTFSWHTDKYVPFFRKEDFFIKYQGLDIENISTEVFWNGFLALMVPLFKLCEEKVVFVFPEIISEFIAETWINFHDAANITISPISNKFFMNLDNYNLTCNTFDSKIGILFGGGKDSSYSFSVLSETYGMENIVLISYVHPQDIPSVNAIDKRREKFILKHLRENFNVKIQKVLTDFMGTTTNSDYADEPHTAMYTGTVLPIILKYNLSILTHNNEFLHYTTGYFNSSKNIFHYKRSRPEYDKYISTRTNSFFKTNISIINLSYFMSETSAFKVLAKRYPYILKYIMMCETTDSLYDKWCLNCDNCCEYFLYSLCYENSNPQIDYDLFFTGSPFIYNIINSTSNLYDVNNINSNYLCPPPIFNIKVHYQSFCHVLASINEKKVEKILSGKGFQNFMILKNRYGNIKYPIYEGFIEPAFNKLNPPLDKKFLDIIKLYCPIIKEIPKFFYIGRSKFVIDYSINCPINNTFHKEHSNDFQIN